jgi:predicted GNAT superfamily acetyltransferase
VAVADNAKGRGAANRVLVADKLAQAAGRELVQAELNLRQVRDVVLRLRCIVPVGEVAKKSLSRKRERGWGEG